MLLGLLRASRPEMLIEVAVTVTFPPCAPEIRLWPRITEPPESVNVPVFRAMVPPRPPPNVCAEIRPRSAMVSVAADTVIWPAFPVLAAVLKRPLAEPVGDLPEIDAEFAVTVRLPPWPALLV